MCTLKSITWGRAYVRKMGTINSFADCLVLYQIQCRQSCPARHELWLSLWEQQQRHMSQTEEIIQPYFYSGAIDLLWSLEALRNLWLQHLLFLLLTSYYRYCTSLDVMGQHFFWTSFSTSEDCTQRHYFATSVSSQFEPSGKLSNEVHAIHYYSWRINFRTINLSWREKFRGTDSLFIFKLSHDPVFIYEVFKNSPKFNCQQLLTENAIFFLVFSCLWEDSITQFFSKHVTSTENIMTIQIFKPQGRTVWIQCC